MMEKRRDFIKLTTMGLAGITGVAVTKNDNNIRHSDDAANKLNIVCLGAHPGDPEFGCGGTMAKYSDAGHNVIFLYVTRGEASDPNKTYAEMAALRTKEAEVACKILKATPMFAGQIDGDTILSREKNEEVSKLLASLKPDIVFTQWPVDGHPDHQVTGLLALTAWVKAYRKFHLYFYEVNTGSETMAFTPTDYVDITNVHDRKKEAMFAHKTQDPVNTYNDFFKPLEEFRGLEAGVKAAEAFIHFKAMNERTSVIGL
ncbi:MAG TPA: PIG-L deacetylase family protein [Chitinophagaceae bacterium]|nr:PIG-L deacetylase family protein [Chitinophagaceae bacterium]